MRCVNGKLICYRYKMTLLSIYHGNEDWILKGLAVDLEKSFRKVTPSLNLERHESFTGVVGRGDYHLFVQQGQLLNHVRSKGLSRLSKTLCIFTHLQVKQFPVDVLNKCFAILFMSSSQMCTAIANGLNPNIAYLLPIGVDLDMHYIMDHSEVSNIQNSYQEIRDSNLSGRNAIGFCVRYWNKLEYSSRKRYDMISELSSRLTGQFNIPVIILGPGWDEYPLRSKSKNILYINTSYNNYPVIYNMMKVFCSVSLHEGGPVPLLESLACGVTPVVTNTGFTFDVLSECYPQGMISINASIDQIISSLLSSYYSAPKHLFMRSLASQFSFDNAALRIHELLMP